jgi:hypothetical protein
MDKWYEIIHIAQSIVFTNEEDSLIWKFENKGVYTVSSMYVVINFRGVTPAHIPSLWKLKIPTRVHVFLWLLANSKLLTRDNLSKR